MSTSYQAQSRPIFRPLLRGRCSRIQRTVTRPWKNWPEISSSYQRRPRFGGAIEASGSCRGSLAPALTRILLWLRARLTGTRKDHARASEDVYRFFASLIAVSTMEYQRIAGAVLPLVVSVGRPRWQILNCAGLATSREGWRRHDQVDHHAGRRRLLRSARVGGADDRPEAMIPRLRERPEISL